MLWLFLKQNKKLRRKYNTSNFTIPNFGNWKPKFQRSKYISWYCWILWKSLVNTECLRTAEIGGLAPRSSSVQTTYQTNTGHHGVLEIRWMKSKIYLVTHALHLKYCILGECQDRKLGTTLDYWRQMRDGVGGKKKNIGQKYYKIFSSACEKKWIQWR